VFPHSGLFFVLNNSFLIQTAHGAYSELAPQDTIAPRSLPVRGLPSADILTENTTSENTTSPSTLSPTARLAIITSTSIVGSLLLVALIAYIYFRWNFSSRTQAPVEDPLPNPPLSPTSIHIVGVSEVPEAVDDDQSMTNIRSPWSPINPGFPQIGPVDFSRSEVQPGTRIDASQTHLPLAERNESGFFSTGSPRLQNTDDLVCSHLS
jgi:hypothetical protein